MSLLEAPSLIEAPPKWVCTLSRNSSAPTKYKHRAPLIRTSRNSYTHAQLNTARAAQNHNGGHQNLFHCFGLFKPSYVKTHYKRLRDAKNGTE